MTQRALHVFPKHQYRNETMISIFLWFIFMLGLLVSWIFIQHPFGVYNQGFEWKSLLIIPLTIVFGIAVWLDYFAYRQRIFCYIYPQKREIQARYFQYIGWDKRETHSFDEFDAVLIRPLDYQGVKMVNIYSFRQNMTGQGIYLRGKNQQPDLLIQIVETETDTYFTNHIKVANQIAHLTQLPIILPQLEEEAA